MTTTTPRPRSVPRGGARFASAATMTALLALVAGPTSASAWVAIADPGLQATVNPCTEQETTLQLHDVELLVSGAGGSHAGFKFRGEFTTGDGYHGSFRDQDQANEVPDAETDTTFTQLVLFNGADDGHRRVTFTSVLHVVVKRGELLNLVGIDRARCVGRR